MYLQGTGRSVRHCKEWLERNQCVSSVYFLIAALPGLLRSISQPAGRQLRVTQGLRYSRARAQSSADSLATACRPRQFLANRKVLLTDSVERGSYGLFTFQGAPGPRANFVKRMIKVAERQVGRIDGVILDFVQDLPLEGGPVCHTLPCRTYASADVTRTSARRCLPLRSFRL